MGFATSMIAIYVKKMIDDRALRKRTLLTLRNELQSNLDVLKKSARIYLLATVSWDSTRSYLVEKESDLFLKLSNTYSLINTRNNILLLHNNSMCFGKTLNLELENGYSYSGDWLDENAKELTKHITGSIDRLNERIN